MKKLLLFLAAAMLSGATNSFAQETKKVKLLSNEEFFSQADFIIETKSAGIVGFSYDAFGHYNRNDIYTSSYRIVTYIYKNSSGINISLGDTINLIRKGGSILKGNTIYEQEKITWPSEADYAAGQENPVITGEGTIFFMKKSDLPEHPDISKRSKYPKVSMLQDVARASIKTYGEITGFDSLHFDNRYELYKYMEQFEGVTVPQLNDPEQIWWDLNGDIEVFNQYRKERNITWKLSQERTQQEMDSIYRSIEMQAHIAWKNTYNKRKNQGLLKSTNAVPSLTVEVRNQAVQYNQSSRKYYFMFDVYVCASDASTYLDNVIFYISYNTAAFGTNIVAKGKVDISGGNEFNASTYSRVKMDVDVASNQLRLGVSVGTNPNPARTQLSPVPIELMKVKIELLNNLQGLPSNLKFEDTDFTSILSMYTSTSNENWMNTCGYDGGTVYNGLSLPGFTIYTVPPTSSTNLNSVSSMHAGTGEILTINGNNFGTQKGQVLFTKDGIAAGTTDYLNGLDAEYIESWTNTQIKVKVPSYVRKGYVTTDKEEPVLIVGHGSGAGSGSVKVRTARNDSVILAGNLNITYSISNYSMNDLPDTERIGRVYLARLAACSDMVFTLHNTFLSNADAQIATEAALNEWSDLLDLKLVLEKDSLGNYVYAADFADNRKNIIGFSSDVAGEAWGNRMMAAVTNRISPGIAAVNPNVNPHTFFRNNGSHIYIHNYPPYPWDYRTSGTVASNVNSFYETMMHEIGHILNLRHVNNATDLMYYTTSRTQISNLTSASASVTGVMTTINGSLNLNWQLSTIGKLRNYKNGCDIPTYVTNLTSTFLEPYPNPTQNSFFIDCESASTIKLYDILGKKVLSQTASGKTEINISHLPKGIYSIMIFSKGQMIENSKIVKQ